MREGISLEQELLDPQKPYTSNDNALTQKPATS